MIKNYLIIAWRNLLKNKVFSLINILGLAIGIAIFVVTMQYVFFERSYDTQYRYADRMFRVTIDGFEEGKLSWQDAESYYASAPALKAKYPEITDYARIFQYYPDIITAENRKFEPENIFLAEPSFLNYFDVAILEGDTSTLLVDPNTVILSSSIAKKYYGTASPVGKSLYSDDLLLTVAGVFKDSPVNSHIHYDMLISLGTGKAIQEDVFSDKFSNNSMLTYLIMHDVEDYKPIIQKIYNDTTIIPWNNEHHLLQSVKDIHLYSHKTYEAEANGSSRTVNFLSIIGFICIIIAWLNYINLSTARSVERAKEVGIRKVSGATVGKLTFQFIMESLLLNLLAILAAITLLQITMPLLRNLLQHDAVFTFRSFLALLPFVVSILFSGMVLSGIYPAFILSRFQPVDVLKRVYRTSQGRLMRKGFTVLQFTAAAILIAATLVIFRQNRYMMTQDTGFNMDNVMAVKFPGSVENDSDAVSVASFYNEISNYSFINGYCAANTLPGTGVFDLNSYTGVHRSGDDKDEGNTIYYETSIDEHFLDILQIKLVAGRNFSASLTSDKQGILINQLACSLLGFDSPVAAINQKVYMGGNNFDVLGVVKDFNYHSLKSPIYPFIINFDPTYRYARFFAFKINSNESINAEIKAIEKVYYHFFPEDIFSSFVLHDTYNQQYSNDVLFQHVTLLFSILAIFIACLGLFGISLLEISSRTKEAGIRKSVGATGASIAGIFVISNLKLIGISLLVSMPVAYLTMNRWLQGFAVKIELGWWFYVIPLVLVPLIALSAICVNMIKIARTNPVESLRYE
jgi:putative ABC transport system permease protein